jgi:hypothetical protein
VPGSTLVLDDRNGCTQSGRRAPGILDRTAPDGSFSLDLGRVSCSLPLRLWWSSGRVVTRDVYAVKDASREDWNQQVPDQSTSYFFCATSTTGFSTVRVGAIYSFSEQTINMSSSNR